MSSAEYFAPIPEPSKPIEFRRSVVINEIFVEGSESEGREPEVFVVLLHKPGKDWWELPGGEIEMDLSGKLTDHHVESEAAREMLEEFKLTDPKTSIAPVIVFGGQLPESPDPIVLKTTARNIVSYGVLMQHLYEAMPEGRIPADEHDDFAFMRVTGLYSPTQHEHARVQLLEVFGRLIGSARTGRQQEVLGRIDPSNPRIVDFAPQQSERNPNEKLFAFSAVTAAVLHRHIKNADTPLKPHANFPRPR